MTTLLTQFGRYSRFHLMQLIPLVVLKSNKLSWLFCLQMAHLAKACTQENPQLRPSMRSIVVALMTLSSSTEDWDVGSFYENEALMNLMSGR